MHDLDARDVESLRGVLAFAVLSHVADLITTQFRDPGLDNEGNPFYQFVEHLGFSGWPWLVGTKVIIVGALGLAFWWYLRMRPNFLPDRVVHTSRSLIWYGMWDRKPYPKSLFLRLFNRRKLAFLALVLGGVALPASGAAALFISIDNVSFALGCGIPMRLAAQLIVACIVVSFLFWYRAYWIYYQTRVHAGAVTDPQ